MPYKEPSDLPDRVKSHLPIGAQKIYMEAFNAAYEQYKDPAKRKAGADREETAHKVAWAAVKLKYEKMPDGNWDKR